MSDFRYSLVCSEAHDLCHVLREGNISFSCFEMAQTALQSTPPGGAILILLEDTREFLTKEFLQAAIHQNIRIYWELSEFSQDIIKGRSRPLTHFERVIVRTNDFGEGLRRDSILSISQGSLFEANSLGELCDTYLSLGHVAGFDQIAYPLGSAKTHPLLMKSYGNNALFSTASLSKFRRGRFMPIQSWKIVWKYILDWLARSNIDAELSFHPIVAASFANGEDLPPDAERQALGRGIRWFYNSRLLLPKEGEAIYQNLRGDVFPTPANLPPGDGSAGILEGLSSIIDHDGNQPIRGWRRADCAGEVAGALAVAGLAEHEKIWKDTAIRLVQWLYCRSMLSQADRANPGHPAYGLLGWHDRASYGIFVDGWGVYYGDDNARAVLGTIAAAGALGSNQWDRQIVRCILANFRTTGPNGFRADRIDTASLAQEGWRSYFLRPLISYSPHFQGYLWACYLWAYSHTGDALLFERTHNAIRLMMEAYPAQWHWSNGLQQERARMILPLAWLVRIQDTKQHREWLKFMVTELLAYQVDCGAIEEQIGENKGKYHPPSSHEDYGKNEAPLLQQNGDPVADLLYTMNFALLGIHEAAWATHDEYYYRGVEKIVDFLVRIQARSRRSGLDGAWFRAFDFQRWEHWGSNADEDWGAWCIETGWTQAWITLVLSMRKLKTSLWKLGENSCVSNYFQKEKDEMFRPDAPL